jgi:exopolyphosphatase / guanosine-5'-triphosphate,3'-diphosphate pyrophosphatase
VKSVQYCGSFASIILITFVYVKFAAIDIGTNAARLLVGEVSSDNGNTFIQKVSYSRIPLRLGEEVFESGHISERKLEDFIKGIKAFGLISDIFRVEELRACATSAMREAINGESIRKAIQKETGIDIEIISGDEEAELIFGTFRLLEINDSIPYIVVDVGGGSTEVSVFENGERVAARSFNVGTLRLLKGKTDADIWSEMHTWLANHVELNTVHQIYATGGNINKTHKMLGAGHMEPIHIEALQRLRDELEPLTINQRMKLYQLRPDRADVLVPALDIYIYILKELNCTDIIVPKIGLSDGMIYQMYQKHSGN